MSLHRETISCLLARKDRKGPETLSDALYPSLGSLPVKPKIPRPRDRKTGARAAT